MNWIKKETPEWKGEVANVTVCDYKTGETVGKAEVSREEWEQYMREMRGPQCVCRADVLSPNERVRLGLSDSQTIWMKE